MPPTLRVQVDNWQEVSEEFLDTWITRHVEDAGNILKKPVVFEEFGKASLCTSRSLPYPQGPCFPEVF